MDTYYFGNKIILILFTILCETIFFQKKLTINKEPLSLQTKTNMEKNIEREVFDLLREKKLTFASAESCTGGNIAHCITLIPGSSEVFRGGAVTYATPTKTKVLGVPAKTIDQHGVVSREVAKAMVKGTRQLMEADFGIATTGVAGPSGGTEQTPVGTVWIGLATSTGVSAQCFHFGKGRRKVRSQATKAAYAMLRDALLAL